MTLPEAAFFAFEMFLIVAVGLALGRLLGHSLVKHLHGYARTQCRRSDSQRVEDIHEAASETHRQATEARMAAEALERHLKGAAHV